MGSAAPTPRVLAVLRQPIAASKLFLGFKAAARAAAKAAPESDAYAFGVTASSRFENGKYTVDPLAAKLSLVAPSVYVHKAGSPHTWIKCKTGRPPASSEDI